MPAYDVGGHKLHLHAPASRPAPTVAAGHADYKAPVRAGLARDASGAVSGPIVVNSSRAILYAGARENSGEDYAGAARRVARETRDMINRYR